MKSYYFIALLFVLAIGCEENPPLTAELNEAPEVKAEAAQPEAEVAEPEEVATVAQAECPCKDGKCPEGCCKGKGECGCKKMGECPHKGECGCKDGKCPKGCCKDKGEAACPKMKAGDCPFAKARAESEAAAAE